MRPTTRAALCLAAGALAAGPALADPPPATAWLSWVRMPGAESCPSPAAMAAAVRGHLGRDPFVPGAERSIEAVVTRADPLWHLRLLLRGTQGELLGSREIEGRGASCEALGAAGALAIALAIDPQARLEAHPAAVVPPAVPQCPAPVPCRAPPPCPAPAPCPPPPRVVRPPPSPVVMPSLRAFATAGLLPGGPRPGIGLHLDLPLYRWLRLRAGGMFLPQVRDGDFAFGLAAFSLGPGVDLFRRDRFAVTAGVNLHLGQIHPVVYPVAGVLAPEAPDPRLWAAVSLELGVAVRLWSRLWLEVGGAVLADLGFRTFAVAGRTTPAFTQSLVAGLGHAGLGWRFP